MYSVTGWLVTCCLIVLCASIARPSGFLRKRLGIVPAAGAGVKPTLRGSPRGEVAQRVALNEPSRPRRRSFPLSERGYIEGELPDRCGVRYSLRNITSATNGKTPHERYDGRPESAAA